MQAEPEPDFPPFPDDLYIFLQEMGEKFAREDAAKTKQQGQQPAA